MLNLPEFGGSSGEKSNFSFFLFLLDFDFQPDLVHYKNQNDFSPDAAHAQVSFYRRFDVEPPLVNCYGS